MKTALTTLLAVMALLSGACAQAQTPEGCRCESPGGATYQLQGLHRGPKGALFLEAQVKLALCCQEPTSWRGFYRVNPGGDLQAVAALPDGSRVLPRKAAPAPAEARLGAHTVQLRPEVVAPAQQSVFLLGEVKAGGQPLWLPARQDLCVADGAGWGRCDGARVALLGRRPDHVLQHPSAPVMLEPGVASPRVHTLYLDVAGLGQVVVQHSGLPPSCREQVVAQGSLRRVSLGGPEGTKGSYKGWRLEGATVGCAR
jgi:hypothetical protein